MHSRPPRDLVIPTPIRRIPNQSYQTHCIPLRIRGQLHLPRLIARVLRERFIDNVTQVDAAIRNEGGFSSQDEAGLGDDTVSPKGVGEYVAGIVEDGGGAAKFTIISFFHMISPLIMKTLRLVGGGGGGGGGAGGGGGLQEDTDVVALYQ